MMTPSVSGTSVVPPGLPPRAFRGQSVGSPKALSVLCLTV